MRAKGRLVLCWVKDVLQFSPCRPWSAARRNAAGLPFANPCSCRNKTSVFGMRDWKLERPNCGGKRPLIETVSNDRYGPLMSAHRCNFDVPITASTTKPASPLPALTSHSQAATSGKTASALQPFEHSATFSAFRLREFVQRASYHNQKRIGSKTEMQRAISCSRFFSD